MFWLIGWISLNGAPLEGRGNMFVANEEVYKEIPADYRVFRFSAQSEGKFTVKVRFWKDGEYWEKTFTYEPGKHTIVIDINRIEDAEMLPTRGIGRKPTIINVKPGNKSLILSDVEIM
ncbi:MAG: hypothetical protein ABIL16_04705 [candidate division WOR-3 bacterium]